MNTLYERFQNCIHRANRMHCHYHLARYPELSPREFMIVGMISRLTDESTQNDKCNKLVSISKLSKTMFVSPPAISKKINDLENKGFVERVNDKNDRRNTFVILTAKGMDILKTTKNTLDNFIIRATSSLNEGELEQFITTFEKIIESMEKEMEDTITNDKNTKKS